MAITRAASSSVASPASGGAVASLVGSRSSRSASRRDSGGVRMHSLSDQMIGRQLRAPAHARHDTSLDQNAHARDRPATRDRHGSGSTAREPACHLARHRRLPLPARQCPERKSPALGCPGDREKSAHVTRAAAMRSSPRTIRGASSGSVSSSLGGRSVPRRQCSFGMRAATCPGFAASSPARERPVCLPADQPRDLEFPTATI